MSEPRHDLLFRCWLAIRIHLGAPSLLVGIISLQAKAIWRKMQNKIRLNDYLKPLWSVPIMIIVLQKIILLLWGVYMLGLDIRYLYVMIRYLDVIQNLGRRERSMDADRTVILCNSRRNCLPTKRESQKGPKLRNHHHCFCHNWNQQQHRHLATKQRNPIFRFL